MWGEICILEGPGVGAEASLPLCPCSCGNCKRSQPCSPVDGFCLACQPGWNGTLCKEPCAPGFYGEDCLQLCPRCRQGEVCDPETGSCQHCEPGWTGPSCNSSCPAGTFGDGCQFLCPECVVGSCDPESGACICQAGYWGASCNDTCPEGYFGVNCSSPCQCSRGTCHPVRGDCVLSATERSKSPELVLSLETKGQAVPEEEPKYENVTSGSADSTPSPTDEPPATPVAT
ncbi:scavenger receptor class f member 1 [Limosa lapponica baueri]|uniref:Scavenger receptor class f member 1 n=1 Tax=Limosa lapponica baueri TaxID=1758121 RepID=A0A2I0T2B1_LIMLA|nr:scavenger receptor class f member 1 [Limosa lapponica baueri]